MRSREVSEASGAKVRLPADPWSNDECPPVHDHRGSGHLSYYQAPEQGFQGCLETTRADLGSGPPVCWVRQTGYVAAEPAPARRSSPRPRSEPASVRGAACVLRGADQRRGPGRGRIRCMEIGVSLLTLPWD